MEMLTRVIHLLSLGLWFGAVTFFSFFTALPIIHHLQDLAAKPDNWLRMERKEQGTRAAGEALGPVFARYFPLQVGCGVVALVTSLYWFGTAGASPKVRTLLIGLALALALLNLLWLAPRVHELRGQRYVDAPEVAKPAEADFGRWHTYSLVADMVTWVCVLVALCLAAALPAAKAGQT